MDFVATVFSVFATLALLASAFGVWTQHAMFRRWRAVPGVITEHAHERDADLMNRGAFGNMMSDSNFEALESVSARFGRNDGVRNVANIQSDLQTVAYRYTVDGRDFEAKAYAVGRPDEPDSLFERYPVVKP